MEPAVKQSLPSFSMMDYKVEYTNHRQFKNRTDRGSVVRIFTNAKSSSFVLPRKEGYKYCDLCERWVYKENKHCFKCEACTSKNGGSYRHCDRCSKCVKETWKHCFECGICKLPEHVCVKESSGQICEDQIPEESSKKRKFCDKKVGKKNNKKMKKKKRKL